jgi:hypothetical protein
MGKNYKKKGGGFFDLFSRSDAKEKLNKIEEKCKGEIEEATDAVKKEAATATAPATAPAPAPAPATVASTGGKSRKNKSKKNYGGKNKKAKMRKRKTLRK